MLFWLKGKLTLILSGIVALLGMVALFFRGQAASARQKAAERDQVAQKAKVDQMESAQDAASRARTEGNKTIQEADHAEPTDSDWDYRFSK